MKRVLFFISMFLPIIGSEGVGDHKRKLDDMNSDILGLFYGDCAAGPADDLVDLTDSLADNMPDMNAEYAELIDLNPEFVSLNTQPLDLRPIVRKKRGIFKCFVENCDREFLYKTSFDSHLENDHDIEANYCLARGNNLQRINLILYKCENCDYKTPKKRDLTTHNKVHTATLSRSYKCEICDFIFVSSSQLLRHLSSKSHIRKSVEDSTTITKQQDEE